MFQFFKKKSAPKREMAAVADGQVVPMNEATDPVFSSCALGNGVVIHPEGERHGVILPGFQYGNSPSQTADADLEGKTLIHTTSAGTQGIVNAAGAEEIITGSLVNAAAIARYIQKVQPDQVSLVAMGLEGKASAPEDVLCARYIKSLVERTSLDMEAELKTLRHTESGEKFFRPETQEVFPAEDYQLCTDVDRFDFVLQVTRRSEDMFEVHRVDL